jgi:hypothetical protein
MKLELEQKEVNNLLSFLSRANIQGSEAKIFLDVFNKIGQQLSLYNKTLPNQIPLKTEKVDDKSISK